MIWPLVRFVFPSGPLNQDESGANMNMPSMKHKSGFTVIELMIVLIIVAILVALAYPSYVDYVRKSRRGEAQQLLMNWSINQEIWRANHPEYARDDPDELPAPTDAFYDFSLSDRSATTYTLQADAKGDQLNDTSKGDCTVLNVNSSGVKTPLLCWGGEGS